MVGMQVGPWWVCKGSWQVRWCM